MTEYCKGCGIKLQNEDPEALGYTPTLDAAYCQRCFKLRHYGELTVNMQKGINAEETFSKILSIHGLVFWIVDIFCFESDWITRINKRLPDTDIIMILTKRDVLPLTVTDEKLLDFVNARLQEENVQVKDILICGNLRTRSPKSQLSEPGQAAIDRIRAAIERERKGRDVVFMGTANAGKSTLLNRLLEGKDLTTSHNPGTTLDLVPIPQDGYTIYDTPGIENHHSMLSYLQPEDLKSVIPVKPIRPFVSQVYEDQSFAVGGLARLDVVIKGKVSVVGYFSRQLKIHRGKLANADDLWKKHLNEMLVPAVDTSLLTMHTYQMPKLKGKIDVVFHGLGWFCISGEVESVYARVHKGVQVTFRKAMI
ncbi:GTPase [Catenisphaera adipataccumulans]|jgi:ribosome biogenesis GTPase YqeH|uniref:Ribosome biogenesis GTPase YqeH n=1 Tax=Catenisphaera adipataccumulans TaxID=700500 RepID=A0A7W8FWP1_9FIRM|nr:GTPase [Catenisphaera adipataccumulans]MBB5183476.1 hypothetical protein [Catenisphaera adipataccumulans]